MRSKKRFDREGRMRNARKWLRQQRPDNLLQAYCRRYGVSEMLAGEELIVLGCWDKIRIQGYEREGVEGEFRMDGYSGEMKVVPKDTDDWDFHLF